MPEKGGDAGEGGWGWGGGWCLGEGLDGAVNITGRTVGPGMCTVGSVGDRRSPPSAAPGRGGRKRRLKKPMELEEQEEERG